MRFALKTIRPDGQVELIEVQARDSAAAEQQAKERGYTVLAVRPRNPIFGLWRGADRFPVMLFSQELRVLLEAGLPMVEAIDTLAEKESHPENRAVFEHVSRTLRQGRPLSAAIDQFPGLFPALYAATLRAAERTSDIAPALGRYVAYARQIAALHRTVTQAMIYPLLLLGVGGLVSLFLMLYVVPRFSRIYEDRAVDLPLVSKALLSWGRMVEGHGFAVAALFALAAAGDRA